MQKQKQKKGNKPFWSYMIKSSTATHTATLNDHVIKPSLMVLEHRLIVFPRFTVSPAV